jgi:hypothetical protein
MAPAAKEARATVAKPAAMTGVRRLMVGWKRLWTVMVVLLFDLWAFSPGGPPGAPAGADASGEPADTHSLGFAERHGVE